MRPFSLLIKPAGPDCNLACRYCFYACKSGLFGDHPHRMSEATAEVMVRDYLGLGLEMSSFAWQGGEPTLMGLEFFEKVVAFQKQYGRDGQLVSNALQTNATLLDDRWCEFLAGINSWSESVSMARPRFTITIAGTTPAADRSIG